LQTMIPSRFLLALACVAIALSASAASGEKGACADGQIRVHGACAPPCPTTGRIPAPDACECQSGYSKILFGDGGGECRPVTCGSGAGQDAKVCTCPEGTTKKPKGQGKAVCVTDMPKAKSTQP
jgi:hypothetical protein